MGEDRITALREQYLGSNWRCMTPMGGKEKMGDVIQVNDVVKTGDNYFAMFDSGSKININMINDFAIRAEDSIGMDGMGGGRFENLNEHDPYAGIRPKTPYAPPTQQILHQIPGQAPLAPGAIPPQIMPPLGPKAGASLLDMPMKGGVPLRGPDFDTLSQLTAAQIPAQIVPIPKAESIFKMFDTKKREMPIGIELEFPDVKLLKMMYQNAADKDKFIAELSDYVYSNINKVAVADAMTKLIGAVQKTKTADEPRV